MATLEISIKKRSAMKAKLTHFHNYLSGLRDVKSISDVQRIELQGRLNKFDALYDDFDGLQMEIEVLSEKPDEAYDERAKFEERYHSLAAQARSMLHPGGGAGEDGSVASSTNNRSGGSHSNFIRLPKIDLPSYGGSYECWLEYRDTFLSLIHNSTAIDEISKFHYLRASLKGSALQIISNIDFNGENYSTAWSLLCERYNNSRLLINNHMQALFNVAAITNESSSSLRQLVDVINKNIRALRTLNEPTEHWDTIFIFFMTKKLDSVTNRDWEEYRNTLDKSPTLSQFCTFISNKADLLETIQRSTPVVDNPRSLIVATNNSDHLNRGSSRQYKPTCPLCSKEHLLYTCDEFRALSVQSRISKAKDLNVCFNCLRTGHVTKRCRLSRCRYCKSKHNTLLHVNNDKTTFQDPMPSSVALTVDNADIVALSSNTSSKQSSTSSYVLLSTALVKAVSNNGKRFDARVLLDSGSTANFITRTLCDKLGLSRRDTSSTVTGG